MSNGITHDKFHRHLILPTSLIVGIFAYFFSRDLVYGIQVYSVAYIAQQFNRLCTPDTDTDQKSFQDFLTKILDPYFSKIWYIIWWPYSKIIPHRHWMSHGLIIGGLLRLAYFLVIISPIVFFTQLGILIISYWDFTLIFILSYCLADTYHLILDFSAFRKYLEYFLKYV